ncbi:g6204 [Coccomyxa elongata]
MQTHTGTDCDFEADLVPRRTSKDIGGPPPPSPLRQGANTTFLIGVAGGTASGKSSVCERIMQKLREDMKDQSASRFLHVAQDNFYRDLTPDEQANMSAFNFDHPSAFAWNEIVATLRDLKAGRPALIPQYDFVTSSRKPESVPVQSADVVLFDGILAFYSAELRELFDLMLFVDVDDDTRLARRVRRDLVERKRDVLHVLEQYERTVKPSFAQFILPTKQFAHIIVPRGLENSVAIDLIQQHIKWRLSERQIAANTRP